MRSFVGWNGLQRKAKRIILASAAVGVLGAGAGLAFGIVAYQDAHRVNSESDPALVYTDLAPASTATPVGPVVPVTPAPNPALDPQDQADVTAAVNALAVLQRTALGTAAFLQTQYAATPWTATVASALGLTPPSLPSGVTVTLNKPVGSAGLGFTVAKNRSQGVVTATITIFLGDDELALDEAARALSALTVSSLGLNAFASVDVPDAPYDESTVATLGLTYVRLADAVTARVSKPANTDTLSFTIMKNGTQRSLLVEVRDFIADDVALVATVATALTTVTRSTLRSSDFFRLAVGQTDFTTAAAGTFGVTRPVLPPAVVVKVTKIEYSSSLTFAVSKGGALQVVAVPVTAFLGDNEDYFAQTATLLEDLVDSRLTRDAFLAFDQPRATFVPAVAEALGVSFPDELWGADISVSKPANSLTMGFTVNKNGSSRTLDVTVLAFANNDQQTIDALASSLEEVNTTVLDRAAFERIVLTGEALDEANAATLGIPLPLVPDGITVTVTKRAGSTDLSFAVSKGTLSGAATATVTNFTGGDKLAVDAAATTLAALTATTLTRNAFLPLTMSGAAWTGTAAATLGLSYVSLPGVSVALTKGAGTALLSFVVSKGTSQRTVSVTVDTFLGDEQNAVDAFATTLAGLTTTSLTRSSFLNLSLPQTNLSAATAQTLGITMPTVPAGTTVRVSKAFGAARLSFTVARGRLTASAAADVTTFTGDTRVALATATSALEALTTSSLTEAAFKAATYAGATFDQRQAAAMGLTFPSLPAGITVLVTKPASSARLAFALSSLGQTASASATVSRFTGDDQPAVTSAAGILAGLTNSTLTAAVFGARDVAQGAFDSAAAAGLGLTYPLGLPSGVAISVAKPGGSNTVAFTLSRGDVRQTLSVVVVTFAAPPVSPVNPNDRTITPGMQRALNYLSGFYDDALTRPLPDRIFNYIRSNFVVLVGGAAVTAWATQNTPEITVANSVIIENLRTIMSRVGVDIGTPSAYAMFRLQGPMNAILRLLLSDPDIDGLNLSIRFLGNDSDQPIYASANIPIPPKDPSVVKTARDAVTVTLPGKYYSYASTSAQDLPIGRVLADFRAANPA